MLGSIFVRIVQAVFTLWILSILVFLSVHLTGDPALYLTSDEASEEAYERIKKNLGLDRPLLLQYGLFLGKAVRET